MKNKKIVLCCCLFICCIILHGCEQTQPKAPDETNIKDAVIEFNMMEFSQDTTDFSVEKIVMSNIDAVQINRQQTEAKENNTYCTIEMSNDSCKLIMDCVFHFSYYDDKKWYPERRSIENYAFYPISGVNEEQSYVETVEMYVNPESLNGDYNLELIEHETDLNNNTDKLTYDYFKSSDFCTESGLVVTYYTFNSNIARWEYSGTLENSISCEYHPEGQWRFYIDDHFYRINISDVDYVNNSAIIHYNVAWWRYISDSEELTDSARVSFTITDEGMSFSSFPAVLYDWKTPEEQIVYLLLKKDTMYVSGDGWSFSPVQYSRYD